MNIKWGQNIFAALSGVGLAMVGINIFDQPVKTVCVINLIYRVCSYIDENHMEQVVT